ncbi:hypothetical protein AOQ84DRAFT_408743 [Glonium stellatum]|uniref:Copper acquisition factor BIM1-like domain-containing protein n=1 Tax=Glonium stellatum TaxID=574774 RepID=A0A8E2JSI2_9PEZI|nr:hypothetical protein AOQ84DRAFT_408743 [Glonium stellatum]
MPVLVSTTGWRAKRFHHPLNGALPSQPPPTIGFDDSLEATPPCGSFTVDFSKDNVTNFAVGGDAIAVTSIHPQATWLFRATLDQTASGNWTALLPDVMQTGLGDLCETGLTLPSSWAGQKGVIGVVQDAPDGILYQCAAVNFISGTHMPPSVCKNVTGLAATYTADPSLSNLPSTATAPSSGSTVSATTSSPASASASGKSAAISNIRQ